MVRKVIGFVLVAALAFVTAAPSAFGWANGGQQGNGYGTHDWILDHAITLAGAEGSWVDTSAALLASDDPDAGSANLTHVFWNHGGNGGAPYTVANLYAEASAKYAAGDLAEASRLLGLLSHHYSDITNPFHSSYSAIHNKYHGAYERTWWPYTGQPSWSPGWIAQMPRQAVGDVRAKTVAAAAFSRPQFKRLLAQLRKQPVSQAAANRTVVAITAGCLSRAVNDLADIVEGIRTGEGQSVAPAKLKFKISTRRPRRGQTVSVWAKCTDAAGRPISGAGVVFLWPTASGVPHVSVAYTGSNGVARISHRMPRTSSSRTNYVTAVARTGAVSITKSILVRPKARK